MTNLKVEKDEELQAIVVCETFSRTDDDPFDLNRMFSADKQSPLQFNVSSKTITRLLLEHLEFNGVNKVFLCYSNKHLNHDAVTQLKETYQGKMKIEVLHSFKYLSVGDIVRDLESQSKLQHHFILTSYDVITNVDLSCAIEQHKKRYKQSKSNVLTAVLNDNLTCENPIVSSANQRFSLALDIMANRIIWFSNQSNKVTIDISILNSCDQFSLITNMYDSGLWICSVDVTHLFVDNFDFQDMMHLIRGVLDNEEIMGHQMFAYFIKPHEFISQSLLSLPQLISVCCMFLQRLIYPIVPEKINPKISLLPFGSYQHQNSVFDLSNSKLTQTLISKLSTVAANTTIEYSMIGENCTIGSSIRISRCFICNDVQISDNCILEDVFISKGVSIGANCRLTHGMFFIGENVTMESETHVDGCKYFQTMSSLDVSSSEVDSGSFGLHSSGFFIRSKAVNDKENHLITESSNKYTFSNLSAIIGQLNGDESILDQSESSIFSDSDDEDVADGVGKISLMDDHDIFISEVKDSIERNANEGFKNIDDLVLEINASKFAYNASLSDVVRCVVETVVNVENRPSGNDRKQWLANSQKNLNKMKALMLHYLMDEDNQKTAVLTLERLFNENPNLINISPNLMLYLYQNDFVSEDAFIQWSNTDPYDINTETESRDKFATRVKCKEFIDFMMASDDDEEDDDED